jgi:hypothetical protein
MHQSSKEVCEVTGYDTTEYFRRHSEDMMMVEDIETVLKYYIRLALGAEEDEESNALREAVTQITPNSTLRKKYENAIKHLFNLQNYDDRPDPKHVDETFVKHLDDASPKGFEELTMREYIDLLLHKDRWHLYEPIFKLERGGIRNLLEAVRETRNKLAHFHGDVDAGERNSLRFCADWLSSYQQAVEEAFSVRKADGVADVNVGGSDRNILDEDGEEVAPVEEKADARESRYAPLAEWLQARPADQDSVELTFEEVERIIRGSLPPYARRHRSWWANDSVSRVQSQQWLSVGWRSGRVNMSEEKVVFSRITKQKRAYIDFFSDLTNRLRSNSALPVLEARPDGRSWQHVARLPDVNPQYLFFAFAFSRGNRFRVELYIDIGEEQKNKQIFDALYRVKEEIEAALREKVSWERLDGKRASRIALYRDASINDDESTLESLKRWAVPAMIRFREVVSDRVRKIPSLDSDLGSGSNS